MKILDHDAPATSQPNALVDATVAFFPTGSLFADGRG